MEDEPRFTAIRLDVGGQKNVFVTMPGEPLLELGWYAANPPSLCLSAPRISADLTHVVCMAWDGMARWQVGAQRHASDGL